MFFYILISTASEIAESTDTLYMSPNTKIITAPYLAIINQAGAGYIVSEQMPDEAKTFSVTSQRELLGVSTKTYYTATVR